MLDTLALASLDKAWSLLIRHAERPEIPAGSFGENISITGDGRASAEVIGQQLGGRIRRLVTSPVHRCVQTADAIRHGAVSSASVTTSSVLGDPGVWVINGDAVGDAFLQFGPQEVVARQLAGVVPGMVSLETGVARLLNFLVSDQGTPGTIDVFVSHDAVIAPLLAALFNIQRPSDVWPGYLEGALFSCLPEGINIIWRGSATPHSSASWMEPPTFTLPSPVVNGDVKRGKFCK